MSLELLSIWSESEWSFVLTLLRIRTMDMWGSGFLPKNCSFWSFMISKGFFHPASCCMSALTLSRCGQKSCCLMECTVFLPKSKALVSSSLVLNVCLCLYCCLYWMAVNFNACYLIYPLEMHSWSKHFRFLRNKPDQKEWTPDLASFSMK